jgi:hypothetical protein
LNYDGQLGITIYSGPIGTNLINSSDDNLSFSDGSLNGLTPHKRIVIPLADNIGATNSLQQCSAGQ